MGVAGKRPAQGRDSMTGAGGKGLGPPPLLEQ